MSEIIPNCHDARLVGVVALKNRQCMLLVLMEEGTLYQIVLLGVERLRVDDFREGNIILDLTVESGPLVSKKEVLFALSLNGDATKSEFVESVLNRIRKRELFLVQINPSYGCVLACICEKWLINELTDQSTAWLKPLI